MKTKKKYENYGEDGESPRKKKNNKAFNYEDFSDVKIQIDKLIREDVEFKTEIPNPDVQRLFKSEHKYGRKRKEVDFEQSLDFHKIVGIKTPKLNFESIYNFPLEKRIDKVLSEKENPSWWENMLDKIKKERTQKIGHLKDRIRNSHQSYEKYP
jgi:hypothetical protein